MILDLCNYKQILKIYFKLLIELTINSKYANKFHHYCFCYDSQFSKKQIEIYSPRKNQIRAIYFSPHPLVNCTLIRQSAHGFTSTVIYKGKATTIEQQNNKPQYDLTWVTTTVKAPAAAARIKLALVSIDFDPRFFKYSFFKKLYPQKYIN